MVGRRWVVAGVVGAVLVGAAVGAFRARPAPDTHVIDRLHRANDSLNTVVGGLKARADLLTAQRDSALHERDSLKVASSAATSEIRRARASIPSTLPPAVVADTAARAMYIEAVNQLDSAIAQLAVKDRIISADSVAQLRSDSLVANLKAQVGAVALQYHNEQGVSAEWKRQFDAANKAAHPLCGRKCGVVLGVLGVLSAAQAVHKLRQATGDKS